MTTPRCSVHRSNVLIFVFVCLCLTVTSLQAGEIHKAAAAGDIDKVKALVEADRAEVESKDERGCTPLWYACFFKHVAVANFLIDKGANVAARTNDDRTPLQAAVNTQDIDLLERLIAKGADVNARSNRGDSPLSWAAGGGNLTVAKLLIDHGADPNVYDVAFGPMLHNAIAGGRREMAKLLIESGAKLNQKDPDGYTEVHRAAIQGRADMVRLLLGYGVDVNAVDGQGRSALYYAAKHGYRSVADALIAGGARRSGIVESNYGSAPQLTGTLDNGEAYFWSLGDNGYAVRTKGHLLIIDPPGGIDESPEAGLANGRLNPAELAGQKITVLIIAPAPDRAPEIQPNLRVFELAKRIPGVEIVIPFKPEAMSPSQGPVPAYRLAVPNQSLSVGYLKVHTIPATLGGVGYLIEADGLKIFYAGYHVCNEASQTAEYRKEIDFLKPFGPIDIAILPVEGHIIKAYTYDSYLYLLDRLSPKAVYLMHGRVHGEYPKCAKFLQVRRIPVKYPETAGLGQLRGGDRFHFRRDRAEEAQPPNGGPPD